jgi:hypothetical protein
MRENIILLVFYLRQFNELTWFVICEALFTRLFGPELAVLSGLDYSVVAFELMMIDC